MSDSWIQLLTVIIANFTIVWWFRKETREDWLRMDREWKEFRDALSKEMRDFHERLLDIESRRR